MPDSDDLASVAALEKDFRWSEAASLREKLLSKHGPDSGEERAKMLLDYSRALFRGAFQADSSEAYLAGLKAAIDSAQEASAIYEKAGNHPAKDLASALREHYRSFTQLGVRESCSALTEALTFSSQSAAGYRKLGDRGAEVEAQMVWLKAAAWYTLVEDLPTSWIPVWKEAEDLVRRMQKEVEENRPIKASLKLLLGWFGSLSDFVEEDPKGELQERYIRIGQEALEVLGDIQDPEVLQLAFFWAPGFEMAKEYGSQQAIDSARRYLSLAEGTRDKLAQAFAIHSVVFALRWKLVGIEEQEAAEDIYRQAQALVSLETRQEEICICEPSNLVRMMSAADLLQIHRLLAELTPDVPRRRQLLEEGLKQGVEAMKISSMKFARSYTAYALATGYISLALLESSPGRRRELLEEARKYADVQEKETFESAPAYHWNIGTGKIANGITMFELSGLEQGDVRRDLLENAATKIRSGIDECLRLPEPSPATNLRLGRSADYYVRVLKSLRQLINDDALSKSVLEALNEATTFYERASRPSRVAETYWKIALEFDSISDFRRSWEAYGKAAEAYRKASESLRSLSETYRDYSTYMQGWQAVAKARTAHEDENYTDAEQQYLEAARLFAGTKEWSSLEPHFVASALIERAENFDKLEQPDSAGNTLREAISSLENARSRLKKAALDPNEKEEWEKWVKLTESRKKYCMAKADIEEAKILDQKGQRLASARMFADAAALLETLVDEQELPSASNDLKAMILLCKAWAEMKKAESEQSSEGFLRASKLFAEAKEVTRKEKAAMLALGNAALCQALGMGAQFMTNLSDELFATAKRQLESAANYYLSAGYTKAASWVRGTERLFDAFVQLGRAESEVDASKRETGYASAEKFLESAKTLFSAAGYAAKQEEAERYLTRAREERELLLRPLSLPGGASFAASTSGLVAPSLVRDQALGVERFEGSSILTNQGTSAEKCYVGETIEYQLEIVNAGKAAALLIKVDRLLPQGCELVGTAGRYKLENGSVQLKGKRLDPFANEDLKFSIKMTRRGPVKLAPKISYLDETGAYKTSEVQPLEIIVQELGIGGWLKGPKG